MTGAEKNDPETTAGPASQESQEGPESMANQQSPYVRVPVDRHDPAAGGYRRVVFAPPDPGSPPPFDAAASPGKATAYRVGRAATTAQANRSGFGFEPAVEAILAEYQRAIKAAQQRALTALAGTTDDERHGLPVDVVAYFLPAAAPVSEART